MKCRRCKTNFDYEAHYGICPKCAAYNRPDGKDDVKTFMGENAGIFEEEYRPPVMSSEGMEEFMWQGESKKEADNRKGKGKSPKKQDQKSFQERLSNPYLDSTTKKEKKKTAQPQSTKKGKKGVKWAALVLVIVLACASEFGEELFDLGMEFFEEYSREKSSLKNVVRTGDFSYTDSWSVAGRTISFGSPYQLLSKEDKYLDGNETLLVIPYKKVIDDETQAGAYSMDCYLENCGLFLRPISGYTMEQAYQEESAGTLDLIYGEEEKNLFFVGDFSELDQEKTVYLHLSFRKPESSIPIVTYRIAITKGENPTAEWTKETVEETDRETGYSAPTIVKLGTDYEGWEARDGYVFYKITQQFENWEQYALDSADMQLYCTDLSNGKEIFSRTEEPEYDSENPLWLYKGSMLPSGETGMKTTVFEVPMDCRKLKATLYFSDEKKEWQASL